MKLRTILCAVFTATLLGSCSYDDGELWDAVNGQEERISALEKWQKTVVEQLNSLQGILTATDYITDVEKVTKDGKEGYKISFLHAAPITLYYNVDNEVSGTGENVIGVAQEEGTGKWHWTLDGEALTVDGKTVYVNGGDDIKVEVNADGSTKLTIGDNEVTVPGPITHPVTGVSDKDNVVTIALNGGTTVDLPKYLNLSKLLLDEYKKETAGEQTYELNLPEGYIIKLLDVVPADWIIEVNNSALRVVYPNSGDAVVTFLISDGKTQTVMKTVTFKAAADPGSTWITIEYSGALIEIPSGAVSVKVTTASTITTPALRDNICKPLKETKSVVNIDLSGVSLATAFPANAFYMSTPSVPETDYNTSIENIILPEGNYPNIFGAAFKNCSVLKSVTINTTSTIPGQYSSEWFVGCGALESIFVPADKVETYKSTWDPSLTNFVKAIE
ncbi:PL29 family lyase N-terminal domain-containing protein [Bacteroides congonensis]|uniref:PL29 family lyase N-terminal domain-containing protein n=1 Tax=Bacteroides congonensis TaxID=1871006 RepID=UPI0023F96962|nr:PL29 family lyase N-terminal domain-containing protein [Bacteroides congonensis]